MKRLKLIFAISLLAAAVVKADSVKTLTGSATYYGEQSSSLIECKERALELARIEALEREYGRIVNQDVYSENVSLGGNENSFFEQLNFAEVKGEWIADVDEPVYNINLDDNGLLVVDCKVKFKARALSNEAPEFAAKVLRNGCDLRFADTRFKSGDSMFVYLKAPVSGYAAIYLACADGYVYTLLPYTNDASGHVPVRANQDYIFFSPDHAPKEDVDPLMLVTEDNIERNHLYVLFSPNKFTKAIDSYVEENVPRRLSFKDFSSWLSKHRRRDPQMGLQVMHLTIEKD